MREIEAPVTGDYYLSFTIGQYGGIYSITRRPVYRKLWMRRTRRRGRRYSRS